MTTWGLRESGLGNGLLAALAGLACLAAHPADALTLSVTGGGLTEGVSIACASAAPQCDAESDFAFSGDSGVTGTIEIVGNVLSLDISIPVAAFDAVSPSGVPGDVEHVLFSGLAYTGSVTVAVSSGPGTFSALALVAGTGHVEGSRATTDGGMNPVDPASMFDIDTPLTSVSCLGTAGSGQCSLRFGRQGFALDLDGQSHDFVHFLNVTVTAVPEPSTLLLLTCALLAGVARVRMGS